MLEVNQVVSDYRQGLAGEADLAGSGTHNNTLRLAGAGTDSEMRVLDRRQAASHRVTHNRVEVKRAVVKQLQADGHQAGFVGVGAKRDVAEGQVGVLRNLSVLRNDRTRLRRVVKGWKRQARAARGAVVTGNLAHTAKRLHGNK